jgi:hypothetical protein
MVIKIVDKSFDTALITQLYPAGIVKTGYKDETTQVSLEWLEVEAKGKVEIDGFAIFVHIGEEKYRFFYKDRDSLDDAIGEIARVLNS